MTEESNSFGWYLIKHQNKLCFPHTCFHHKTGIIRANNEMNQDVKSLRILPNGSDSPLFINSSQQAADLNYLGVNLQ